MILRNFIVFEGIDGAGTTTQARLLKERLADRLQLTAEPTTGEVGKFLRRILRQEISVTKEAAAYLFAADRAEHLFGAGGIIETAKSKIVLSDRYLFSSLVYQGEAARLINSTFPLPEMLFYFCISGEEAYRRVLEREGRTGQKLEMFERRETLCALSAKYNSIIEEYLNAQNSTGMKIITLDASKGREELSAKIWEEIDACFSG